jgi:hypothetical protein
LRRIVLAVTALVVLVAAAAAYAATSSQINTYTSPLKFTPNKAGSKKKPSPISFHEAINAMGTNGNRTAVLLNVKTKIYGLKVDGKDFPTCSAAAIAAAHNDTGCPKGALVATGSIVAQLGAKTNFTLPGTPCAPDLHVWNSGQGKLTFFFVVVPPTHVCGGLQTGSTPPYKATYKVQGGNLITNVPIPAAIDFPVQGVAGSLTTENLTWLKRTKKVHGKTVASISSVACKGGKRPYSTTFTANLPSPTGGSGVTQSATASGSAKCSK